MTEEYYWKDHKTEMIYFPSAGFVLFLAWWIAYHLGFSISAISTLIGGTAWCAGYGICAAQDFKTKFFSPTILWRVCLPGCALFSFGIGSFKNILTAAIFGLAFAAPQIIAAIVSAKTLPDVMREEEHSKNILWRLTNWGDIDFAFVAGFFIGSYTTATFVNSLTGYLTASCLMLISAAVMGIYRFKQKTTKTKFRKLNISMGEHYYITTILTMWITSASIFG